MNSHELAALLDGSELAAFLDGDQRLKVMGRMERRWAKESGLVAAFRAGGNYIEFCGAVNDEINLYEYNNVFFTKAGLLLNTCDDENCPHFERLKMAATPISIIWGNDRYSFTIETAIPHATFDVLQEGEKYCRGIVFALSDVPEK